MIEPYLISYLTSDSAIAARIGSGSPVVYRMYWERLPQNPILPAIIYFHVGGDDEELLDGNPNLAYATYEMICTADTGKAAAELASLVKIRMMGLGGDGFQKVRVKDQGSTDEDEVKRYNRIIDVTIAYAESSP